MSIRCPQTIFSCKKLLKRFNTIIAGITRKGNKNKNFDLLRFYLHDQTKTTKKINNEVEIKL